MDEKYILVMYDVCGIQEYIFRTNKVKEIIEASNLVEKIIEKALENSLDSSEQESFISSWKLASRKKPGTVEILEKDSGILGQVLYIGGGNAYILFRSENLLKKVNRRMSKYILENTYSLKLAIAKVDKTESFSNDYRSVREKMALVKQGMPGTDPLGVLPITRKDELTGYPLVDYLKDGEAVSWERLHKVENAYQKETEVEKIFDYMVEEKGVDSMLAVVHIDGNNMGERIEELLCDVKGYKEDYKEEICRMRQISSFIEANYNEAFENMKKDLDQWVDSENFPFEKFIKIEGEERQKVFLRKIIGAGDDLTFVCNGKLAFYLTECYLKDISKK